MPPPSLVSAIPKIFFYFVPRSSPPLSNVTLSLRLAERCSVSTVVFHLQSYWVRRTSFSIFDHSLLCFKKLKKVMLILIPSNSLGFLFSNDLWFLLCIFEDVVVWFSYLMLHFGASLFVVSLAFHEFKFLFSVHIITMLHQNCSISIFLFFLIISTTFFQLI